MREVFNRASEAWGRITYRYRWLVIIAMIALAAGLASQMRNLTIDTSTEGMLEKDDPVLVDYNAFRNQFGRDGNIIIAIQPPQIFDLDFLKKLKDFHEEIEAVVPKIQKVTSLINVRNTRGEGDELIVKDLLEDFPKTQEDLRALRERVLANPLYRNLIISEDGRVTAVLIETDAYSSIAPDGSVQSAESEFEDESPAGESPPPFITGEENAEIVHSVMTILARYQGPNFRAYISGTPVVVQKLEDSVSHDMQLFTELAIGIIAVLLYLLMGRVAAVILPLFVILLSLLSTLGLMGVFGVPITLTTQIMPSFLLAVGVGYAVHLLVVFFQGFDECGNKEESLVYAMSHSGVPIMMTALTTMVGMLSFTTAVLRPIAMFGVFVPVGVFMSFLYSIALLPALLAVFPMRPKKIKASSRAALLLDKMLIGCGSIASRHPWKTVIIMTIVVAFCMVGALQVRFSHNSITWFPKHGVVRTSSNFIDRTLGGTIPMEVVIDTGKENGLYEPEVLNRMEAIDRRIQEFDRQGIAEVGKTVSLLQIIKETNQALHGNDPAYYSIPDQRNLVAQELLLFENSGSDDLEDFVDSQFQIARMTLVTHRRDSYEDIAFIDQAKREFQQIMGDKANVVITGLMPMMSRMVLAVIDTLARSYIMAFLMITPLMMLLIGSLRGGLVSMVPNLAPIIITLGFMGWIGLPLDIFTLLIGCISIGLAVDDTIHFIHSFQRYYASHDNAELAVHQTLETTGKALLFTSVVLCSSFFIYMASPMNSLFRFGLLTGFTIGTAFICDMLVTPALLVLVSRTRKPAT